MPPLKVAAINVNYWAFFKTTVGYCENSDAILLGDSGGLIGYKSSLHLVFCTNQLSERRFWHELCPGLPNWVLPLTFL